MPNCWKRFLKISIYASFTMLVQIAMAADFGAYAIDNYGGGGASGCPGSYEPPPYEPPVCEPPPYEPPPYEPPVCEPAPYEPPPCEPPVCEPPPCEPPPCEPPVCEPPPCEPPPCEPPPPCEQPPCQPPPCQPPPCQPPVCEPPKENPPPPDEKNPYSPDLNIAPIFLIDGHKTRFITAEKPLPCAVKQCKKFDDAQQIEVQKINKDETLLLSTNIYIDPSSNDDVYIVEDRKDGLLFIGALIGIGLVPDVYGIGGGIGLAAILEGNVVSHRSVAGLKKARRVHGLKRPKKAKDIEKWHVGDSLQYSFGLGGMAPIGIGAFGVGAGFAPIAEKRWRVTIVKVSDCLVKLTFDEERDLAGRLGLGSIVLNSSAVKISVKGHKNSYDVDISTEQGKKDFEELMEYKHMFDGGIKDYDDVKDDNQYQFVHLTDTGDIEIKAIDHKKLRVRLPFLLNYSKGEKIEKIHEDNQHIEGGDHCNNQQTQIERKTKYKQLTAPNNLLKKKNHRSPHRERQFNRITEGLIKYENNVAVMSAQAKLRVINNRLKKRHFNKMLARVDAFIAVKKKISELFVWPDDSKQEDSLVIQLSLSLDDNGIKKLLANRNAISCDDMRMTAVEFKKISHVSSVLKMQLEDLAYALHQREPNEKNISNLLRKIIINIRDNFYLLRAIDAVAPGALSVKVIIQGTNVHPIEHNLSIGDLI